MWQDIKVFIMINSVCFGGFFLSLLQTVVRIYLLLYPSLWPKLCQPPSVLAANMFTEFEGAGDAGLVLAPLNGAFACFIPGAHSKKWYYRYSYSSNEVHAGSHTNSLAGFIVIRPTWLEH